MYSYRNRRLGTDPFRLQTATFSSRDNSADPAPRAWATALSIMTGFALPVVGATAISAEEAPADSAVEEVIVSSRTPDLIDQIGVSVSVLDSEDMRSLGSTVQPETLTRTQS